MVERDVILRPEKPRDASAIFDLTQRAFASMAYSDGTEGPIIDALRNDGDLSHSLIAFHDADIVGHIAFSPATLSQTEGKWYALGPISVEPSLQKRGIGSALVHRGLAELRDKAALGCVLIGDPTYYGRFGFKSAPTLTYANVPMENVMALAFSQTEPKGEISFARGFGS